MMEQEQLQSDQDVDEILKLAIRKSSPETTGLRSQLEKVASEMGISAEALREAETEYLTKKKSEVELAEWRRARMNEFKGHLISFVLVCAGLIVINVLTTKFPWAIFPIMGWGSGIWAHYNYAKDSLPGDAPPEDVQRHIRRHR